MSEITAWPVRCCPNCGGIYIEDDQMQEDVDRCPNCGAFLASSELCDATDEPGAWV